MLSSRLNRAFDCADTIGATAALLADLLREYQKLSSSVSGLSVVIAPIVSISSDVIDATEESSRFFRNFR